MVWLWRATGAYVRHYTVGEWDIFEITKGASVEAQRYLGTTIALNAGVLRDVLGERYDRTAFVKFDFLRISAIDRRASVVDADYEVTHFAVAKVRLNDGQDFDVWRYPAPPDLSLGQQQARVHIAIRSAREDGLTTPGDSDLAEISPASWRDVWGAVHHLLFIIGGYLDDKCRIGYRDAVKRIISDATKEHLTTFSLIHAVVEWFAEVLRAAARVCGAPRSRHMHAYVNLVRELGAALFRRVEALDLVRRHDATLRRAGLDMLKRKPASSSTLSSTPSASPHSTSDATSATSSAGERSLREGAGPPAPRMHLRTPAELVEEERVWAEGHARDEGLDPTAIDRFDLVDFMREYRSLAFGEGEKRLAPGESNEMWCKKTFMRRYHGKREWLEAGGDMPPQW